ncbi:hypothetical protein [Caloranaerobacter azorensis]|uniref:Uncharacterized protein n=1 Tax=Caloranaerobacter azorensis DSM 13643 TaxID=1121264 RepID=A0A1M5VVI6_9FIRM|nr:hypothetical protein [Caloranaerobacter azorensis]SHH79208.1 hypothetical protein SAMN02745135_02150 [Caloranaerobacter azorensis DSM 13643]
MPRRYRYYVPPVEVIDEIENEKEEKNEEQRHRYNYGSYWWIILLFIPLVLFGGFSRY